MTKSSEVRFRMQSEEIKDLWTTKASKYGLSLPAYIRWRLGCPLNDDVDAYLNTLHKIEVAINKYGTNLNQIAVAMNTMVQEGSFSEKGKKNANLVQQTILKHTAALERMRAALNDSRA